MNYYLFINDSDEALIIQAPTLEDAYAVRNSNDFTDYCYHSIIPNNEINNLCHSHADILYDCPEEL